ncbi:hypothetical protein KCTCHS21_49420 [Cohnella abietis]|uniref:Uncharacterized protein n=1 Tax=Cohnella abietis TaxID=2507935 RepID=A0A3T1DBS3_9BACL|nr:hypothetical protein KCTCHS21_49420 [Cohnella abietis]
MTHHIKVTGHFGHEVPGAVAIVIVHVLTLNFVVQVNPYTIQHVLRGTLIQDGRKISQTRTQQGKSNDAQTKADQQRSLVR